MVPNVASQTSMNPRDIMLPLIRSSTLPASVRPTAPDRSLLAPEDAIYQSSPPRRQSAVVNKLQKDLLMTSGVNGEIRLPSRRRHKDGHRSRSRHRVWKKLLWVKQSYPDNYTDQDTFLEHLQRNPRLQPYDFWPLVADSTVIVQHVCSVIIFIVCFVGMYQKRITPFSVVGWGSVATFLGWLLWDWWVGKDQSTKVPSSPILMALRFPTSAASSTTNLSNTLGNNGGSLTLGGFATPQLQGHSGRHSHSASASSIHSQTSNSASQAPTPRIAPNYASSNGANRMSHRTALRLSTAKSALLIYFTLLGLSPILKSLTKSTSSDSIWAMSFLLFTINIFFFDYGTPVDSKNIPASLSTNAALMASTVLASRLPGTNQVFSLTLFSIEVFGLFPVFRRYCKQHSWRGHVTLTTILVLGASGGVGLTLGQGGDGDGVLEFPWKSGIIGTIIGVLATGLAMGGCSWWLIGLQKYKNEIHGPWDPARPVIRRHYDYFD
ncbi:phosphatidylinositol N-acetylglucosaminyltransferase-domain-containing protein [Calycina marina]|uniref:Phosphatidylinositol N-acetylglucosaminyltransferase-domain-containing protein n=1 Tax=Calycina marina TaxID=1763456 RepID=A0A9P7Z2V8_9HELO|nr:phosphatidylinositol N-acetylglucosaminyltransferase-domain-containing protein [Calycina marina]